MFRTTTRVYAVVNVSVALLVLLTVFFALNWDRMPDGFAQFLSIRITVKNLFIIALFLLGCVMSFRAFGLSKPSPAAPFWTELFKTTKACTVASIFALPFPLTSQTGTFTGRVLLYFLPASIVACLCGASGCSRLCRRFSQGTDQPPRHHHRRQRPSCREVIRTGAPRPHSGVGFRGFPQRPPGIPSHSPPNVGRLGRVGRNTDETTCRSGAYRASS